MVLGMKDTTRKELSLEAMTDRWQGLFSSVAEMPSIETKKRLEETRNRIGQVIWIRWLLLIGLLAYGLVALGLYSWLDGFTLEIENRVVPGAVFLFAWACNGWYHITYRHFSKMRLLALVQVGIDLLFVTVMVHFSGGTLSWLWGVYFVLVLEATFLLEKRWAGLAAGMAASLAYGAVLAAETAGWLEPVPVPYNLTAAQTAVSYAAAKWGWVTLLVLSAADFGCAMMSLLRKQRKSLQRLVILDELTGLYNRRYFFQRLHSEMERARRYKRSLGLLVLDIDDFKQINDTYGHQAGDRVLEELGAVIRKHIRGGALAAEYDLDVPCRYGGEEFVVILPEALSSESLELAKEGTMDCVACGAWIVAERLRQQIELAKPGGFPVTASIGVASYPGKAKSVDDLVALADKALYAAKRNGKNQVMAIEDLQPLDPRERAAKSFAV